MSAERERFFALAATLGFAIEASFNQELVVYTGLWDVDGLVVAGHTFTPSANDESSCDVCGGLTDLGVHDQ